MKVVVDIECNALENPTEIWVIVCKEIESNIYHVFRNVTSNEEEKNRFLEYSKSVSHWIGHNFLGYDYPVLNQLMGLDLPNVYSICSDTLVLSKLVDYSRQQGHSVESYGEEFGLGKIKFSDWSKYSQEMEDYCVRDVDITHKIYLSLLVRLRDWNWDKAIKTEQEFEYKVIRSLHNNGFCFNSTRANTLLSKVTEQLSSLDKEITDAFPNRLTLLREVHPERTKHGTLHKKDFRWVKDGDLSDYNGYPFSRCIWKEFNPSSHKQIIDVLTQARWKPIDKTKTHIETERDINRLKYTKEDLRKLDIKELSDKLEKLKISGWKINENNLSTLPPDAPAPARLLAKRIMLESRRRTLTEWLSLVKEDGRIHGKFYGIGAWTHRMAHQEPNTANIPNEFDTGGKVKLLGKELRSLWKAPNKRLLVGVDAEGIQLRIFAHYINDPEFTDALVKGRKDDKTDPHSLNQRVLGNVCKSRAAAKRFIYALLLGAGLSKLTEILECSEQEAKKALDNLLVRYTGFAHLKQTVIPEDASKGYFVGLDNRKVPIPGETLSQRKHLTMSGYLQNGEAIIMKEATLKFIDKLNGYNSFLVNFVHDEWQTETPNDVAIALQVAQLQADSLRQVGEELNLNCPMAGSYWNDDHKDYTIGTNWYQTH